MPGGVRNGDFGGSAGGVGDACSGGIGGSGSSFLDNGDAAVPGNVRNRGDATSPGGRRSNAGPSEPFPWPTASSSSAYVCGSGSALLLPVLRLANELLVPSERSDSVLGVQRGVVRTAFDSEWHDWRLGVDCGVLSMCRSWLGVFAWRGVDFGVSRRSPKVFAWLGAAGDLGVSGDTGIAGLWLMSEVVEDTRDRGVSNVSENAERGVPGIGDKGGTSAGAVDDVGVREKDLEDHLLRIPGFFCTLGSDCGVGGVEGPRGVSMLTFRPDDLVLSRLRVGVG